MPSKQPKAGARRRAGSGGRRAALGRKTKETQIHVSLDLDGSGRADVQTTIPFLDHMLSSFAKHGRFDLEVRARGDTEIDDHHLVEDVGIVLGQAFAQALGGKEGIFRFGEAYVPLDEALVRAVVDLSDRPYLVYKLDIHRKRLKAFDTELVEEFYKGFVTSARVSLHLHQLEGRNTHHVIESSFKAFGVAVRRAAALDDRICGIPSTKGVL